MTLKRITPIIAACSFLLMLNSCITPEVTTNSVVYEKLKNLRDLYIAFMPIEARALSASEIEDVTEEIIEELSTYGNIKKIVILEESAEKVAEVLLLKAWEKTYYYQNSKVINMLFTKDQMDRWKKSWNSYLNNKEINTDILNKVGSSLKVNSVLQFDLTNIKHTRPVHRKVIAATTAEIKYTLFSTAGKVLLEGNSVATQANAWSGQMTPLPIEAIDAAIDDIFDKFPFAAGY